MGRGGWPPGHSCSCLYGSFCTSYSKERTSKLPTPRDSAWWISSWSFTQSECRSPAQKCVVNYALTHVLSQPNCTGRAHRHSCRYPVQVLVEPLAALIVPSSPSPQPATSVTNPGLAHFPFGPLPRCLSPDWFIVFTVPSANECMSFTFYEGFFLPKELRSWMPKIFYNADYDIQNCSEQCAFLFAFVPQQPIPLSSWNGCLFQCVQCLSVILHLLLQWCQAKVLAGFPILLEHPWRELLGWELKVLT